MLQYNHSNTAYRLDRRDLCPGLPRHIIWFFSLNFFSDLNSLDLSLSMLGRGRCEWASWLSGQHHTISPLRAIPERLKGAVDISFTRTSFRLGSNSQSTEQAAGCPTTIFILSRRQAWFTNAPVGLPKSWWVVTGYIWRHRDNNDRKCILAYPRMGRVLPAACVMKTAE